MISFHKILNFEVFLNSKKHRGSVLFLANTTINIVDASLLFCFLSETTQIENPRTQWRQEQERMLKEYLVVAQEALNAKKEMYLVKQQRLELAQQEMLRLDELSGDNHSITSTFSGSSSSAKYDPDQIKVEIACKREREDKGEIIIEGSCKG
ncbi:Protein wwc3 [Ataeniobius toweri]|uniref:Protein wwc3 n=1 Tax=Ataeniobius toweri TaxID=208326 RepID=A0ABU7ADA0_9TELE|nr:Protein wwc3 [Ataeniobius toweri]